MLAGQSRTIYAENASGLLKFSEGPSDCRRAVLRISASLLSFAGECSQTQTIIKLSTCACATRPSRVLSKGEIGEILTTGEGRFPLAAGER